MHKLWRDGTSAPGEGITKGDPKGREPGLVPLVGTQVFNLTVRDPLLGVEAFLCP